MTSAQKHLDSPLDFLTVGFIVNPFAGVGGPSALKGSDAKSTQDRLVLGELAPRAGERAGVFLRELKNLASIHFVLAPAEMGEAVFSSVLAERAPVALASAKVLDYSLAARTSAHDTRALVAAMLAEKIDLLVFVGGDGTARDIFQSLQHRVPVVGVPAGVKMHSGVFAINPLAAARVVDELVVGNLVSLSEQEVRDIDEAAFQQGIVKSRYFGSMWVPDELRYMQNVKQGGVEVDELVLADIAAEIKERLDDESLRQALIIFAPGSTTQFIQTELGVPGTLLGVDVYQAGELIAKDADARRLEELIDSHEGAVKIVLTAIGGQGHVIGRGNQQLSPKVLRAVGKENLWIVMTKTKLKNFNGRPLLVDSNDPELDLDWTGLVPVITGYRDQVLYGLGMSSQDANSEIPS